MTAAFALLSSPAAAIVGGAAPSPEGIGRSVITIVGSRGNFCTGSLIAPTLVLTAAHCVQPGAEYKIVEYDADRVTHPGAYGADAVYRCLSIRRICWPRHVRT